MTSLDEHTAVSIQGIAQELYQSTSALKKLFKTPRFHQ